MLIARIGVLSLVALCSEISLATGASLFQTTSTDKHAAHAEAEVRRHERHPDDGGNPFELDGRSIQFPRPSPMPLGADTPFVVERTGSYMPFVVDGATPESGPVSASEVQSGKAQVINTSPFVMDNDSKEAQNDKDDADDKAHLQSKPAANSPFVMDTEVGSSKSAPALSKNVVASHGKFSIVRNSDTHPGPQLSTTAFVRVPTAGDVHMTTEQPTTSTGLRFELGGSLIDIAAGQEYVPIPNTPFEVETHIAHKLARKFQQTSEPSIGDAVMDDATARSPQRLMRRHLYRKADSRGS
jgi:hypothetical protein